MAWEDLELGTAHGITGDIPFDELSEAFSNIRRYFVERLGRPPHFTELLRLLHAPLAANPPTYISDATLPPVEPQPESEAGPDIPWVGLTIGSIREAIGDVPFDEMRSAVNRIRRAYVERFGRNPYFAELAYPSLIIVEAEPDEYVADAALPSLRQLANWAGRTPIEHIDPGPYEGSLDMESDDFNISPRGVSSELLRSSIVVRGEVTKLGNKNVLCRYEILSPTITDGMAKSLIRECVLRALYHYDTTDRDLSIRFERRA
jgi:hypothetical protein